MPHVRFQLTRILVVFSLKHPVQPFSALNVSDMYDSSECRLLFGQFQSAVLVILWAHHSLSAVNVLIVVLVSLETNHKNEERGF